MDVISRLPGCAGQAADAVSAYTQVKMEDAQKLFQIPKSECPWHLGTSTKTQMAKFMVKHGRPGRSSWAKSVRSSFCRTIKGKAIWESSFGKRFGKKFQNWECLFVNRKDGLFSSVYVDEIKIAGKKQNLDPMWKILMKGVDLGEPTSFHDRVYVVCTQTRMQNKQRCCGQLQEHSWIQDFSGR